MPFSSLRPNALSDRRGFLATAGLLTAGAAVAGEVAPQPAAAAGETPGDRLLAAPPPSGGDDTAVLQRLLVQAQQTGVSAGGIQLQAGTYRITRLQAARSVVQPMILGQGPSQTKVRITSADHSGIKLIGGGSASSGALVQDLTLHTDNATSTALEFNGIVGARAVRVNFTGLGRAVLFANTKPGDFTEFCVVRDSSFDGSLRTHVEYYRSEGNESFHGTGFENCIFNQRKTDTHVKIRIGARVKLYNAPFDGIFFLRTTQPFVAVSPLAYHVHTYGRIRTEGQGTGTRVLVWNRCPETWYHAGTASHLNQGTRLAQSRGTFRLVHRVQSNSNGSLTAFPMPFEERWKVGPKTVPTVKLGQASAHLVSVTLLGRGYEVSYLLSVWRNLTDGGGAVKVLAKPRSLDLVRRGGVTFRVRSSRLTLQNRRFPRSGVTAIVSVVPLTSTNQPFPLQ